MRLYQDEAHFSYKNVTKFYETEFIEERQLSMDLSYYKTINYKLGLAVILDKSDRYNPFADPREHIFITS